MSKKKRPLAGMHHTEVRSGDEPKPQFSTQTDKDAVKASLLFNIAHYAIRPWPWIIVALVSIVSYPELSDPEKGYPKLMVDLLPNGLLGLLVVSFLSAFMSTVSTHLNWGSSYIVNDFYKQQINKNASEKQLVNIGRISTITLFLISAVFALLLTNALQLFDVILMLFDVF